MLLGGAAMGGVFVATILMLYYAIRGLVGVGVDSAGSDLVLALHDEDHA